MEGVCANHPVRREILALYKANRQRSLTAQDLLSELGGEIETTHAAVAYHVRVLKQAELLPGE